MNNSDDWPDVPVVSAHFLNQHLHDDTVRVIDGSMHLPGSDRNAREECVLTADTRNY